MNGLRPPDLITRGVLLFWTLYFMLVWTTNFTDALNALGVLEPPVAFASGNYELIRQVTAIYGTPEAVNALLFGGVLFWEAVAAGLFFIALRQAGMDDDAQPIYLAFGVGLALWSTFVLMDELFIAYHVADLESTHVGLFTAHVASLIAIRLFASPAKYSP